MSSPIIGIAVDVDDRPGRRHYRVATAYADAVEHAGGMPVGLAHAPRLAEAYVQRCDAIVLTGGLDPRMEGFGVPTAPEARPIDTQRQAFDLALLEACDRSPETPVLAICLGMQLMALHRGGALHQALDRVHDGAARHADDRRHGLCLDAAGSLAAGADGMETVVSNHRQAVATPGDLLVAARSDDGIIEAVEDPGRPFCLGVQWHPERGGDAPFSLGLFRRLVAAVRPRPLPPAPLRPAT